MFLQNIYLFFFFSMYISVHSISIKSLLFHGLQPVTNSSKFKGIFQDAIIDSPLSCSNNCSNHGTCTNNSNCICETDYQGYSCSTYCPKNCSSNGYCAMGLGCLCSENFQGIFTLGNVYFS